MLVWTYWPYYFEMECKENYRRVMAACVRKVDDNDKNIIQLGQSPLDVEAHREIRHCLEMLQVVLV